MLVRGLKAALNSNGKYKYKAPEFDVDHLVIGAGVAGLAVARALAEKFPERTTYVVERNATLGEETSSRNSEVIHAGLYYPAGSLKESLCVRGRLLLYDYCDAHSVPYKKLGKLIIAGTFQKTYVDSLRRKAASIPWPSQYGERQGFAVPTELLTEYQARDMEPNLGPRISAALFSPETGIIDSHALMSSLEDGVANSENGELVYSTSVVRIDPHEPSQASSDTPTTTSRENGWVVQMVTQGSGQESQTDSVFARTVINAGGLSGPLVLNSLLKPPERIPMYYAKGSYAAYNGPGVEHVSRLLYPCPDAGVKDKQHSFQSLGTHLTLDLAGNVKFGPDIQWISPPSPEDDTEFSYDEHDIDYWKKHLVADDSQLEDVAIAVQRYLPDIHPKKLRLDYVGIRPKLVSPLGGFQDFVIRKDHSASFLKSKGGRKGGGTMISLLGIESPGLTASLAIAEEVISMVKDRR